MITIPSCTQRATQILWRRRGESVARVAGQNAAMNAGATPGGGGWDES
jgi:hypothetical protein